jgi:hypothetical protein
MLDLERLDILDLRRLVFAVGCTDCGAAPFKPCCINGMVYRGYEWDGSISETLSFCQARWRRWKE